MWMRLQHTILIRLKNVVYPNLESKAVSIIMSAPLVRHPQPPQLSLVKIANGIMIAMPKNAPMMAISMKMITCSRMTLDKNAAMMHLLSIVTMQMCAILRLGTLEPMKHPT